MTPRRLFPLASVLRLLAGAMILSPLIWAVWASLAPIERLHAGSLPWSDQSGGGLAWSNYADAVSRLPFARFIANSILLTLMQVAGTVLTCSMTGYVLAQHGLRGGRLMFVILLATMMVPSQVVLIAQFVIYEKLGWVGGYRPLIVPAWLAASSFFVYLFREFFRTLPRAYHEAARVDGATPWQIYRHVMLPMARPIVGAVACLSAMAAWHGFLEPLVYLADYRQYPISVGLRMYQSIEGSRGNLLMAASLLSMLPPLAVLVLARRLLFHRAEERAAR